MGVFVRYEMARRAQLADSGFTGPLPEQFSLKPVGPAPEVAAGDARFSPYATANGANRTISSFDGATSSDFRQTFLQATPAKTLRANERW